MIRKLSAILAMSLLVALTVSAQEPEIMGHPFDFEGFVVGGTVTKAQLIQKFGTPDNYESWDGTQGFSEWFDYGDNAISLAENEFVSFSISDTTFAVLTLNIQGGLKVGMPISKIQETIFGEPYVFIRDGVTEPNLRYIINGDLSLFFEVDEDGIIQSIFYAKPC